MNRYDPKLTSRGFTMETSDKGKWVYWDEFEAEVERLEVYEALYNGMRGDYVKVKDEIQRLRELAERRGSTTAKGEH